MEDGEAVAGLHGQGCWRDPRLGGSRIQYLSLSPTRRIVDVSLHPEAESLYVEQIDVGEAKPRQVGMQRGIVGGAAG